MAIRTLSLTHQLEALTPESLQQHAPALAWAGFRWLAWAAGIALALSLAQGDILAPTPLLFLVGSAAVGLAVSGLVFSPRPSYMLRLGTAATDVVLAAVLVGFSGGLESTFLPYTFAVVVGAGWLLGIWEGLVAAVVAGLLAWGPPEMSGSYFTAMTALLLSGGLGRWIATQGQILAERAVLARRAEMLEGRIAAIQEIRQRAGAQVLGSLEPSRVYEAAASVARDVLRAQRTVVLVADETTGELRPAHVHGGSGEVTLRRFAVPISGPADWATDARRLRELLEERGLSVDLAAPLQLQHRILGVLAIQRPEVANQADQDALHTLADLTAAALATARVHVDRIGAQRREALRQAELGESLINLQGAIANLADSREISRRVATEVVSSLRVARAGVFLLSEHGDAASLAAVHGLGWDDARTLPSYIGLAEERPLAVRAIRARRLVTCGPGERDLLMGEPDQAGSGIAVPLVVGDEIVGAVFAEAPSGERQWREPEQRYLRTLAHQVGLAIRNAHAQRVAERWSAQLQSVYQAAQVINSQLDPAPTLLNVVEQATAVEGTYLAGLVLTELDQPSLRVFIRPDRQHRELDIDLDHELFAAAIATREPRIARSRDELPPELLELGPLSAALVMPLHMDQRVVGLLVVARASEGMGTPDFDLTFLRYLANQATLAIGRARLFEQARVEEHHNATLHQVGQLISSSLDLRDALRAVAETAAEAVEGDRASIYLFDGRQYLAPLCAVGFDQESEQAFKTIALEVDADAFTRDLVRQKRPLQVDAQVLNGGRLAVWPLLQPDVRRVLGVPMIASEQVVGALFIHERHARHAFSVDEIDLLTGIARQAAVAVENDELGEAAREALRREQLLTAVSRELAGGRGLEHRLAGVLDRLAEVLPVQAGSVAVREGQHLRVLAAYGSSEGSDIARLPDGREMVEWLAEEGKPYMGGGGGRSGESQSSWSYLAVPVGAGTEALGVVHVESERSGAFGERELTLLSAVASQVAGALVRERLKDELQELSRWQQQALQARDMEEGASRLLASAIIKLGATDMMVEVDPGQALEELRQAREMASDALQQLKRGVSMIAPPPAQAALPGGRA